MKKILLLPLLILMSLAANAQCVASFAATAAPQGNNLLRYYFQNTSAYGTGIYYTASNFDILNYGDGTVVSGGWSSITNTYHTYATPGTYNVGLRIYKVDTVTHAVLCTDTTTQTITVAYSACASSIAVTAGLNGAQTFTATTPAGTSGMTYSWNFGDGSTGTGSPVTHSYAANGTYTVTLVASGGGCSYTNTYSLTVSNITVSCSSLQAAFYSVINLNIVSFNNTSTTVPGLVMATTWTYGDGTSGTANSHIYAASGSYTVKLKVKWLDSATQNVFCQDSIIHTVNIMTGNTGNIIEGMITYDSTGLLGVPHTFRTWLIQYDSLTNSLAAVDSLTQTNGYYTFFSFTGKPAGNYLVKTAILNQTIGASGFMPTYHDSSLYWNTAHTINHTGSISFASVYLQQGIVTSGPGFVAGNVSLGANKGVSAGVPGITVFLRDPSNNAIACTATDGNGDFSFSNIPVGTYSVYPEHMNYATTPKTYVVVTSAMPTVTDATFYQDNTLMNIKPHTLAIGDPKSENKLFSIYPNPASKTVNISWNGSKTAGSHILITNTRGQVVIDQSVDDKPQQSIDIAKLASGLYFVRSTGTTNASAQKLIVE